MKIHETKDIRNVALLGHTASGKTTFSEAMVHTAGLTSRMGKLEEGNTKSDFTEDEISRQISISLAVMQLEWGVSKVNVIDTPGYADFIGEMICGLRAADTAAVFIDAVNGLEVGTEMAWDLCNKDNKPRVIVINRCGREHSETMEVLEAVQNRFGIRALPVQIPVNPGIGFNNIIDVISMKDYSYTIDGNGKGEVKDIPEEFQAMADELHEKVIEAAAESDDELMEKFFDFGLTPEEVVKGVKEGITHGTLYPIVFADALTNVGADLFIELLAGSTPSPADMPAIQGFEGEEVIELTPTSGAPMSMLVFKTIVEAHVGELSVFRLFSGDFKAGDELYNYNHSASEKASVIFNLDGKERDEVPMLSCGDIGTFVKMKHTGTGDTFCTKSMQFKLPGFEFPAPVMDVAVYPEVKGEEDKIHQGLSKLHDEDPSFIIRNDSELHQIILEAQGGIHVDVLLDKFKHKFGTGVILKAPKIPYRETITGKADEKYRYKKQTGGRGQYGEVYLRMESNKRGEGYEFSNDIKGGVIPARFIPGIEKGINASMIKGPLSHSHVIDLKISLYYGSFHSVDSSELAFKMAASHCFKDCFLKSKPILLEPIENIEVKVPDTYTGDVMGDISSRRGKIMGMEPSGVFQIIKAQVPLAELYQYATLLRSLTHGRGAYTRSFSHYEQVASDVAQKVIESTKKAEEEA